MDEPYTSRSVGRVVIVAEHHEQGKVKHLKDVNVHIERAKKDKEAAIYYHPLLGTHYCIAIIHDPR